MTKGTDALPLAAKALILCAMNDNIRVIHPLQSRREGAISADSAALAQLVRALDCGSRGPPFKPGRRYHLSPSLSLLRGCDFQPSDFGHGGRVKHNDLRALIDHRNPPIAKGHGRCCDPFGQGKVGWKGDFILRGLWETGDKNRNHRYQAQDHHKGQNPNHTLQPDQMGWQRGRLRIVT